MSLKSWLAKNPQSSSIALMWVTIVLSLLVSVPFFLVGCGSQVYAQTATSSAKVEELTSNLPDAGMVDVGKSQIAPDSPLYFLKAIRERVEDKLADKKSKQLKTNLEFLQRRLREVITLVEHKRWDLVESTMEQYRSEANKVRDIAASDVESRIQLATNLARHTEVLQRLYNSSSDLRAKEAILATLENSDDYNRNLVIVLDTANQQILVNQIVLRQAQLCLFFSQQVSQVNVEATKELLQRQTDSCKISLQKDFKDQLDALRKKK